MKTTAILLAGGIGKRMLSPTPKQFLELDHQPIACHSFNLFLSMPEIDEIVVVCAPDFRKHFNPSASKPVLFALPGERRQDSVFNGLRAASNELICIHDAARPFINREAVSKVLEAGSHHGAATLGLPLKFTIKESCPQHFVKNTPDRSCIWEIQTPQVIRRDILEKGFEYANHKGITVTDDVSLAELIGKEVKLVEGLHTNFKVTVPADLIIANHLIDAKKQ